MRLFLSVCCELWKTCSPICNTPFAQLNKSQWCQAMSDKPAASHSYFKESSWPVECGGNTRSKLVKGELNVRGRSPRVIHKNNARWNVMFIHRKPGELYLTGTLPAFKGPAPFGWVQKIDIRLGLAHKINLPNQVVNVTFGRHKNLQNEAKNP